MVKEKIYYLLVFVLFGSYNTVFSQCTAPPPFLGNDTSFCEGQSITLNAGSGYATYFWDNNTTSQTRSVFQAGTYWVTVSSLEPNLVVNGDFEQGNTGFSTDYVVGTGGAYGQLTNEGTYAVSSSPNLVHTNFSNCTNHTPAPGTQMLVVNGSGTPNTNVWCQTISVTPNTDYQFSSWVGSALTDPNVAQLQFSINGIAIGGIFSPSSSGCQWGQFYQVWNSGSNTSAQICIVNQNTTNAGNDFILDDINFSALCYQSDTINVTELPRPVINVGPNDTICSGETASITASSSNSPLTYTWNPGNISGATLNVSPTSSTIYNVTAADTNGCVSNLINRTVVVQSGPNVSIVADNDTICSGDAVQLTAQSSVSGVTYAWDPPNSTTSILVDSPNASTDYSVIAEDQQGCMGYDTISIHVIPPLQVDISGNVSICEGEFTTLTATGNLAGMTFEWSDQSVLDQITVNPGSTQSYSVEASYENCPSVQDQVEVQVNAIPTVNAPEDLEICFGETVTVSGQSSIAGSTIYWLPNQVQGSTYTIQPQGSEFVYLYADNNGCISPTDSFFVEVVYGCNVEVPNVFTPNGDNSNDAFTLISQNGIKTLECLIINRWGQTIRTFDTATFSWDGTNDRGEDVSEGTYFYRITGETVSGNLFEKQGFVELVR